MDFLKKNSARMAIAGIATAGAILMLVVLIQSADEFDITFIGAMQLLGPFLFFLGTAIAVILSMFDATKRFNKWAVLATGVLVTLTMTIGLIGFQTGFGADGEPNAEGVWGTLWIMMGSFEGMIESIIAEIVGGGAGGDVDVAFSSNAATNAILFGYIIQIFAFGLIPLIVGLKKVLCGFFGKEEAPVAK